MVLVLDMLAAVVGFLFVPGVVLAGDIIVSLSLSHLTIATAMQVKVSYYTPAHTWSPFTLKLSFYLRNSYMYI